jgi:hypothetical protein
LRVRNLRLLQNSVDERDWLDFVAVLQAADSPPTLQG